MENQIYPSLHYSFQLNHDFKIVSELHSNAIIIRNEEELIKIKKYSNKIANKMASFESSMTFLQPVTTNISRLFKSYLRQAYYILNRIIQGQDYTSTAAKLRKVGEVSFQLNQALEKYQESIRNESSKDVKLMHRLNKRIQWTLIIALPLVLFMYLYTLFVTLRKQASIDTVPGEIK